MVTHEAGKRVGKVPTKRDGMHNELNRKQGVGSSFR